VKQSEPPEPQLNRGCGVSEPWDRITFVEADSDSFVPQPAQSAWYATGDAHAL